MCRLMIYVFQIANWIRNRWFRKKYGTEVIVEMCQRAGNHRIKALYGKSHKRREDSCSLKVTGLNIWEDDKEMVRNVPPKLCF